MGRVLLPSFSEPAWVEPPSLELPLPESWSDEPDTSVAAGANMPPSDPEDAERVPEVVVEPDTLAMLLDSGDTGTDPEVVTADERGGTALLELGLLLGDGLLSDCTGLGPVANPPMYTESKHKNPRLSGVRLRMTNWRLTELSVNWGDEYSWVLYEGGLVCSNLALL
ncbi:hypothetical protein MD484_g2453, partial [Candolleomyces efflorescens]